MSLVPACAHFLSLVVGVFGYVSNLGAHVLQQCELLLCTHCLAMHLGSHSLSLFLFALQVYLDPKVASHLAPSLLSLASFCMQVTSLHLLVLLLLLMYQGCLVSTANSLTPNSLAIHLMDISSIPFSLLSVVFQPAVHLLLLVLLHPLSFSLSHLLVHFTNGVLAIMDAPKQGLQDINIYALLCVGSVRLCCYMSSINSFLEPPPHPSTVD